GVSPSTLQRRLCGQRTATEAQEERQRLSALQEGYFVNWILHKESCRHAPSKVEVRALVAKILLEGGNTQPLGKNWIDGFLDRNKEIKAKVSKPLSAARAQYTTKGAVVNFFNLLKRHIQEKGIKKENIANMDENGVQEG
ncbi:hypothetical protein QBC43DRAFT_350363, partial [Cladorrhinum sp. PSN259]